MAPNKQAFRLSIILVRAYVARRVIDELCLIFASYSQYFNFFCRFIPRFCCFGCGSSKQCWQSYLLRFPIRSTIHILKIIGPCRISRNVVPSRNPNATSRAFTFLSFCSRLQLALAQRRVETRENVTFPLNGKHRFGILCHLCSVEFPLPFPFAARSYTFPIFFQINQSQTFQPHQSSTHPVSSKNFLCLQLKSRISN